MRYRTLNRNWQYNRVYGRGKSYVHPHVVLYVAKNRAGVTRVGLTATKRWATPCSATARGASCGKRCGNTSRQIAEDMI